MEHEDKQLEQNNQPETESKEELQETSLPPSSNTVPTPPDSTTLSNIRTRIGLDRRYLPENISIQTLLSSLKDADWRVRVAAVRRLGSMGDGKHANVKSALVATLSDSAPAVRAAAARALGDLDDDVPEEQLLFLLRNDTDDDVRTAAVQALAPLRERMSPYTLEGLKSTFERTGESDVTRASVIYTLGRLEQRTPIDLLRSAMGDRDWLVREAAALMMGEQGERADEEALRELANSEDEYPEVTQAAYQALGNLAVEESERLAKSDPLIQVTGREQSSPIQPTKLTYAVHQHVGDVEFDGIQPGSLNIENHVPVISQALDNQWMPRTVLKALLTGRVSFESVQDYLTGLARTEYLRSLINGEQAIINRAFIYNSSIIARDYMQSGPSREVFKQFLSDGTIIPFLLYEKSPDEQPKFAAVPQNLIAWQQICREAQMQCMRFSWLDEGVNKAEIEKIGTGLHSFSQFNQSLNIKQLISDLGLPTEQETPLKKRLSDIHMWSYQFYEESEKHINREDIYKRYITVGNPSERNYDGSKQFSGEIKQLFDLVYSSNLANALNGYLLTPVDSPTSLILQDWNPRGGQDKYVTTSQLVQMIREKVFQIVQSGLYLRSIGMLRLQDVHVIRNTDEWRAYIGSLQRLLQAPLQFGELANNVYQDYIKLAHVITKLVGERDALMGGLLTAEWRPNVRLIINVGGSSTTVVWGSDEDKVFTDAAEQKDKLPQVTGGIAPVNVRLIIGDSTSPSKLHTSIDLIQSKMQGAQMQWLDLCDRLIKQLYLREFSTAQTQSRIQSENSSNLNAMVGSGV